MKISTKSRYAIEALLYMASLDNNIPINISDVADRTKISQGYLEQIFFKLRKSNILTTKRGRSGGYFIVADINKLTTGEIMRAVDEDIVPVACLTDPKCCSSNKYDICSTRKLWEHISDAIFEVVDYVTISQLLDYYRSEVSI
jgi:Rrf2 family protein